MPRKTQKEYPENWEEIARGIKERDGWRCQQCGLKFAPDVKKVVDGNGKTQTLGVHHKDRNPQNNDPANLVTLCSACHCRAEWPLIRREMWEKKHKDQLKLF